MAEKDGSPDMDFPKVGPTQKIGQIGVKNFTLMLGEGALEEKAESVGGSPKQISTLASSDLNEHGARRERKVTDDTLEKTQAQSKGCQCMIF